MRACSPCTDFVPDCLTCSETGQCFSCGNGARLFNNTCVAECPARYYNNAGVCARCDSTCLSCNGQTENDCLTCDITRVLDTRDSRSECVDACANGFAAVQQNNGQLRCEACETPCTRCLGNVSFCTKCTQGVANDGACVTACPVTRLAVDGLCQDCQGDCYTCAVDLMTCTGCTPLERFADVGIANPLLDVDECEASCPPGFAIVEATRFNNTFLECQVCAPGTFRPTVAARLSAEPCQVCPKNTFSAQSQAATCLPCPQGTETAQSGASSASSCQPCADGFTSLGVSDSCRPCPGGTFFDSSSRPPACVLCPAGTSSTVGQTLCQPCASGQFQPFRGQDRCLICSSTCQACVGQSTNCTACASGLQLGGKCLPNCARGSPGCGPSFTNCPGETINAYALESGDSTTVDYNLGLVSPLGSARLISSHTSGSGFPVGQSTFVRNTAQDVFGNQAFCDFAINVARWPVSACTGACANVGRTPGLALPAASTVGLTALQWNYQPDRQAAIEPELILSPQFVCEECALFFNGSLDVLLHPASAENISLGGATLVISGELLMQAGLKLLSDGLNSEKVLSQTVQGSNRVLFDGCLFEANSQCYSAVVEGSLEMTLTAAVNSSVDVELPRLRSHYTLAHGLHVDTSGWQHRRDLNRDFALRPATTTFEGVDYTLITTLSVTVKPKPGGVLARMLVPVLGSSELSVVTSAELAVQSFSDDGPSASCQLRVEHLYSRRYTASAGSLKLSALPIPPRSVAPSCLRSVVPRFVTECINATLICQSPEDGSPIDAVFCDTRYQPAAVCTATSNLLLGDGWCDEAEGSSSDCNNEDEQATCQALNSWNSCLQFQGCRWCDTSQECAHVSATSSCKSGWETERVADVIVEPRLKITSTFGCTKFKTGALVRLEFEGGLAGGTVQLFALPVVGSSALLQPIFLRGSNINGLVPNVGSFQFNVPASLGTWCGARLVIVSGSNPDNRAISDSFDVDAMTPDVVKVVNLIRTSGRQGVELNLPASAGYTLMRSEWSRCDASCNEEGQQTRSLLCTINLVEVDLSYCSGQSSVEVETKACFRQCRASDLALHTPLSYSTIPCEVLANGLCQFTMAFHLDDEFPLGQITVEALRPEGIVELEFQALNSRALQVRAPASDQPFDLALEVESGDVTFAAVSQRVRLLTRNDTCDCPADAVCRSEDRCQCATNFLAPDCTLTVADLCAGFGAEQTVFGLCACPPLTRCSGTGCIVGDFNIFSPFCTTCSCVSPDAFVNTSSQAAPGLGAAGTPLIRVFVDQLEYTNQTLVFARGEQFRIHVTTEVTVDMALLLNGQSITQSFGTTTIQSAISTTALPSGNNQLAVQLLNWKIALPVLFVVTDAVVEVLKPLEGDRVLLNQPQTIALKAFSGAQPRSGSLLVEQDEVDWPIERVSADIQPSGQVVTEYRWTTNEARLRAAMAPDANSEAVAAQFQLVIATGQGRRRAEGQAVLTPSITVSLVDEELYNVRLSVVGSEATVECLHYGPSSAMFQVSVQYNGLGEQVVVSSLQGGQTSTFQLDLSAYVAEDRVELVAACESKRDSSVWRSSRPITITVPMDTSSSRGGSKSSCSGLECGGALAGLIVGLLVLLALVLLVVILLRRRQAKAPMSDLPPPTTEQNDPDKDLYRWNADQQQHQAADVDKRRTLLAMINPVYAVTTPAPLVRQASDVSDISNLSLTQSNVSFEGVYCAVGLDLDPRLAGARTFSTSVLTSQSSVEI